MISWGWDKSLSVLLGVLGARFEGEDASADPGDGGGAHRQVLELHLLHPDVPVSVDPPPPEVLGPGLGEMSDNQDPPDPHHSVFWSSTTSRVKHLFLLMLLSL